MTPIISAFVPIYALHDVESVRREKTIIEGAFGKALKELDADIEFSPARDFVAAVKQRIEDRRDTWRVAHRPSQIGGCLRLVWDLALYDRSPKAVVELRMEVMKALFLRMFHGKWSAEQLAHVDLVVGMLKDWASFFVSYTNRSAKSTNDEYEKVINKFVEPSVLRTRNWGSDNLVADAVVALLRRENLMHGFYDKINIQVSDDLDQKIGPAAGGSFMFVQLVQRDTFSAAPPPPNWCFEEYNIFQRHGEGALKSNERYREVFRKRFAPILADDTRPAMLPYDYESWVARVFKEKRYEKLPADPQGFDETVHKLALEIVNLHGMVIDCVPE